MTTIPTVLPEHALTTAADLRAVREQWGDLLVAIEQRPADTWPPRETRGFLDQLGDAHQDDEQPLSRTPLTIRQHPAPANLTALDAALAVEAALFTACDSIATRSQRPARPDVPKDREDPRRWTPPTVGPSGRTAAAGSRAHGLHWAAVWLEGRALGEDQGDGLFGPLGDDVLDDLATVARRARRRVEAALGRDGRTTALPDPCPWCGGELLARTVPGGEPSATCQTGEQCQAPAALDRGRRTWRGADLAALWAALDGRRRAA
ncbi:tail assembly protein [Streptomyces phage Alderaan]|nr:tail assembly protein [Streptomyces phage Alderaan]